MWHETPHRRCQRTTVLVLRLLDVPAQLENVDDDKDNVILLVHCSRSPPLAFGEHLTGQFGGGLQWIIAYDRLSLAKRVPRRVLSFGQTVGLEQEAME